MWQPSGEWDELDEALRLVPASPPSGASDSDEDIAIAVNAAAALGRCAERYKRRGFLLTRMMRERKAAIHFAKQGVVAEHIRQKINVYNEDVAKTLEDVINLDEKRVHRSKGDGPGSYKRWIAPAIQRVCWGLRPRQRQRVTKKVRKRTSNDEEALPVPSKRPRMQAPTASSTRTWANFSRASSSHIQALRNATSEQYLRVQKAALLALPHSDSIVLNIFLDETEEPVAVQSLRTAQSCHVMTCHMQLARRAGSTQEVLDIVLPPTCILGTGAEHLKAALFKVMPVPLQFLRRQCDSFTIVLATDAAKSCLRLGRHIGETYQVVPAVCRLHQGCLAMVSIIALGGLSAPLFCASLLMRRRRIQVLLRASLKKLLQEKFVVEYVAPSQDVRAQAPALLQFMHSHFSSRRLSGRLQASKAPCRLKALGILQKCLTGRTSCSSITHYCPYGCHSSAEAAREEVEQALLACFLHSPPAVPAFNKWNKIYGPLAWFTSFSALHGILPQLLSHLVALHTDEELEFADGDADEASLDDRKEFARQEQVRFRRAHNFFASEYASHKLVISCMVVREVTTVMSAGFIASRRFEDAGTKILDFIVDQRNPALKVVRKLLLHLIDEQSAFWQPVRSLGPWSTSLYTVASTPVWTVVGQLYSRLVLALRSWPWRLGLGVQQIKEHHRASESP